MKIAVMRERRAKENRVAITPSAVTKLTDWGFKVVVESGAGDASGFSDADYFSAGAQVVLLPSEALRDAQIILKVRPPILKGEQGLDELSLVHRPCILIGLLQPHENRPAHYAYAAADVSAFSLELWQPEFQGLGWAELTSDGLALAALTFMQDIGLTYRGLADWSQKDVLASLLSHAGHVVHH